MIPTTQLLEAFCEALAEMGGPGDPDHWEMDPPNGWSQDKSIPLDVHVTCKDANGLTVTTYAGPVDFFPTGQMNPPDDHGWTDGVLFITLTAIDAGGAGLFIIDQATGVPQGFVEGDFTS